MQITSLMDYISQDEFVKVGLQLCEIEMLKQDLEKDVKELIKKCK